MSEAEVFESPKPIAVYDQFRAQLAEIAADNAAQVFDYEDEQGNEDARSHVYKLRKTKSAIEKARKAAKAASLEYGRRVDGEAKDIVAQIEEMIEVHAAPLKAIEDREAQRVADIADRLAPLTIPEDLDLEGDSAYFQGLIDAAEAVVIDDSLAEFEFDAETKKCQTLSKLERLQAGAKALEDAAEARAAAEAEAAVKAQAEREERIAAEAAENARLEAEAAAEEAAENAAQEAADREAKLKADAEAAEQAAADAAAKAKREQKEKEAAEKAAQEKRDNNQRIRKLANNKAKAALMEHADLDEQHAQEVVEAIVKGLIPKVSITY